jgi:hypothetical protein
MQTEFQNPIQKLIEEFEAGRLHARRLSDGALIEELGDLVTAILADDAVVGPRAKFEQVRAERLAARNGVGAQGRPFDATQDRPFSRILIPPATGYPYGNETL